MARDKSWLKLVLRPLPMTDQVSSWVAKRVEPVGIFEEEEEKEDEEEDEDEEEEKTGVSFKGDDRH